MAVNRRIGDSEVTQPAFFRFHVLNLESVNLLTVYYMY